ncbi:MAG: hypothetical protein HY985_15140 [Magnetospirillum sp.]|nr:hypothetical protein [Magnetospirillum sp.]
MSEPVVMPHPLRDVIVTALAKSRARGRDDAVALAAAVRTVLEVRPELGISDAYDLVSRLWVR